MSKCDQLSSTDVKEASGRLPVRGLLKSQLQALWLCLLRHYTPLHGVAQWEQEGSPVGRAWSLRNLHFAGQVVCYLLLCLCPLSSIFLSLFFTHFRFEHKKTLQWLRNQSKENGIELTYSKYNYCEEIHKIIFKN